MLRVRNTRIGNLLESLVWVSHKADNIVSLRVKHSHVRVRSTRMDDLLKNLVWVSQKIDSIVLLEVNHYALLSIC